MNFPGTLLNVSRDNGMKVIVIKVTGIWIFANMYDHVTPGHILKFFIMAV